MRRVLGILSAVALVVTMMSPIRAAPARSDYPNGNPEAGESNEAEASIRISSFVDIGDGKAPPDGWQFAIVVTGGSPSEDTVTTNDVGEAAFTVSVLEQVATVEITDVLEAGFELTFGSCVDLDRQVDVGTLDGATLRFDVEAGGRYLCEFGHATPYGPWVEVGLQMAPGQILAIKVTHGTADADHVTADDVGFASFKVTIADGHETSTVEISDTRRGYGLGIDDCVSNAPDGEAKAKVVRGMVVLEVVRQGRYGCELSSAKSGAAPNPTAPPTDTVVEGADAPAGAPLLILLSVMAVILTNRRIHTGLH